MDPSKTETETKAVVQRIRAEVDRAKEHADENFDVYVSTNLAMLEDGSWKNLTAQPQTCHMQALRQVLTPMGLYNCPAHRGVEKALIGGKAAYKDEETARTTADGLAGILKEFDASHECRQVTCLYNDVNWWIERMIEDPRDDVVEVGAENEDYFL
jgi:hypothetical protein